jgi:type I restriction enzyme M protein
MNSIDSAEEALAQPEVLEAIHRGIMSFTDTRVTYQLHSQRSDDWADPEEWVRACTVAWLIVERGYPANRIKTEVTVPRRTPSDFADIVVYSDDACREPYLVVENKASGQSRRDRLQGIEQLFGNANSLRAPLGLYEEGNQSAFFDVANHPAQERQANRLGDRTAIPAQYGQVPVYTHIAGQPGDIEPVASAILEARIRRAHSLIWAGGRRDPLTAFDEWSKLLFAKVIDERMTPSGEPRRFQIGTRETTASVANRIHGLFEQARRDDPTIFPDGTRITLTDSKVTEVVRTLQGISFTRTDIDSIGKAFEQFFGSIFRGGLGQYFTMRQLARFVIATLDVTQDDYLLDPTAGSGGFLLEALLQVWHYVDRNFHGQPAAAIQRLKIDFALTHVYGIEIHEILGRICKINLLLHHDGHTNIESNRSCLDSTFTNPRLNPPRERFTCIVGNPPFGTDVEEGDEDKLGSNHLASFTIAANLSKVASEQVIIERSIELLEPGGRFGLIVPDGLLNNQGTLSNCPQTRMLLGRSGRILAITSLPDYAFRKSGAQNKTSILFFKKFTRAEKRRFDREYDRLIEQGNDPGDAVGTAITAANLSYSVFLGEANHVGYTTVGAASSDNDLYRSGNNGAMNPDQTGTILHEWRTFKADPTSYQGRTSPDCMGISFDQLWSAHTSHRLDPKYHLFKREAARPVPNGWVRAAISAVMRRREVEVLPDSQPDHLFQVMTISQTGEIRAREAGKGRNPPQWLGTYFADSPGSWFAARAGDVVFSSIDLWKGCIAIVPEQFDEALVSKEFPIYEVIDRRLSAPFLQCLLRSRYYQRAFRAITTGHSNRRRTQAPDFEALEIAFPQSRDEQERLIAGIQEARLGQRAATDTLRHEFNRLSDLIDGRGDEELPDIPEDDDSAEE